MCPIINLFENFSSQKIANSIPHESHLIYFFIYYSNYEPIRFK